MITDSFQRTVKYLRISITDRCNLRCVYCRPGKCSGVTPGFAHIPHDEIMSYEELLRLARVFVGMGVEKIRVTGGEPLVRKNVPGFIAALSGIIGVKDVALTTNGVLLPDNVSILRKSGLRRINISLDSLVPEKFERITGRNEFARVWEGIRRSVDAGFDPVKINVVAMRGVNDDEFLDFAALTLKMPVHVRFIEFMPMALSEKKPGNDRVLNEEIFEMVRTKWNLAPMGKDDLAGPAENFRIENAQGTIGFISPVSSHFCGNCNRMRITAAGNLKPCLLSQDEVDIKTFMRSGADDDDLRNIIANAASVKWQRHAIMDGVTGGAMFSIGG